MRVAQNSRRCSAVQSPPAHPAAGVSQRSPHSALPISALPRSEAALTSVKISRTARAQRGSQARAKTGVTAGLCSTRNLKLDELTPGTRRLRLPLVLEPAANIVPASGRDSCRNVNPVAAPLPKASNPLEAFLGAPSPSRARCWCRRSLQATHPPTALPPSSPAAVPVEWPFECWL